MPSILKILNFSYTHKGGSYGKINWLIKKTLMQIIEFWTKIA